LRWISSCFPQDLHSWEPHKLCCSQYWWGSYRASNKIEGLKTVRIRKLWQGSGEWNFLFVMVCNFFKLYYYRLIHSDVWILLSTHAMVRREFDQLFTRAAGNVVLVQTQSSHNKIGNVLINLKLRYFRLPVVVKKQFVLKILIAFL